MNLMDKIDMGDFNNSPLGRFSADCIDSGSRYDAQRWVYLIIPDSEPCAGSAGRSLLWLATTVARANRDYAQPSGAMGATPQSPPCLTRRCTIRFEDDCVPSIFSNFV